MLDAIKEYFTSLLLGPGFAAGRAIWNACMEAINLLIGIQPEMVSNGKPWQLIANDLYPTFLIIGASLMNLLFAVGFFKETADVRQNITLEKTITLFIKVIVANFLLINGLSLIRVLLSMASALGWSLGDSFEMADIHMPANVSAGNILLYWVLGLFFVIAAIICGLILLWTVYKRFLNLFLLIVLSPIAFSTFAGDRGISNAGVAWIKNFLCCCFEIVVITLALILAGAMLNGGSIFAIDLNGGAAADLQAPIEAILTMVITTGAVKGAESLLRKSFNL